MNAMLASSVGALLGLVLIIVAIFIICEKIINLIYSIIEGLSHTIERWEPPGTSVKEKQQSDEEDVKIIKKPSKTLYYKKSKRGVLAMHNNGKITVDLDFKYLIDDLKYRRYGGYYSIQNPTEIDREIILDRLYD